jgi:hypothetical protein
MSTKSTERSSVEDKNENESCDLTGKDREKKGKQPVHGKQITKKSSKEKSTCSSKESALTESENVLLKAISALQGSINKQSERMGA